MTIQEFLGKGNNSSGATVDSTSYTVNSYTSTTGTSGKEKSLNEIVEKFLCQQSMETADKITEGKDHKDPQSIIDLKNNLIENGMCLNILVKDINQEIADLALAKLIEIYNEYNNSKATPSYPLYPNIQPWTPSYPIYNPIDPYIGIPTDPTCVTGGTAPESMKVDPIINDFVKSNINNNMANYAYSDQVNADNQDTTEKRKPGRPKKVTTTKINTNI